MSNAYLRVAETFPQALYIIMPVMYYHLQNNPARATATITPVRNPRSSPEHHLAGGVKEAPPLHKLVDLRNQRLGLSHETGSIKF